MLALLLPPARGVAEMSEEERSREERIQELERKVEVLIEELAKLRTEQAVPDDEEEARAVADAPLESPYGTAPAASKVYRKGRGVALGGYAEGIYRKFLNNDDDEDDQADLLRLVTYFGYKFNDKIVFNSEIELEHAATSRNGDVSVEFATLDFLLSEPVNIRAGLVLVPMGFLNEVHEPPFFFGVQRPEVERRIIPSTWRENGVGVFGSLFDDRLIYRSYVINGFDATGFRPEGLRGGRQNGSNALANDLAFVARADWLPTDSLMLGASVYTGNSGQNQKLGAGASELRVPPTQTTIWEAHAEYRGYGVRARALYTEAYLEDTSRLTSTLRDAGEIGPNDAIGKKMAGGYVELGYDVLPLLLPDTEMSLEPFYRFSWLDSQDEVASGLEADGANELRIHTVGLQFKPIPRVVLKANYRDFDPVKGSRADEFEMSFGLVF